MYFRIRKLLAASFLVLLPPEAHAGPNFVRDIQPILETNCLRCHKQGKAKGGLRMETHALIMGEGNYTGVIVPGSPEQSDLIRRTHLRPIDEGFMPDEGQALKKNELDLLTAWVKSGAHWPEGVSLVERKPAPVKRVAMPEHGTMKVKQQEFART